MKIFCIVLTIALCCSWLLCGCGAKENAPSEPDYSAMIQPPVDVNITDCITADELTAIMGTSMELLGVYEENSQAVFLSEDGHQVTVHMLNQTLAGFEAMKNSSSGEMVWQEGLGEAAYRYGDTAQLMFYSGGYAVDVAVTGADEGASHHTVYMMQIAEAILRKLPQGAE